MPIAPPPILLAAYDPGALLVMWQPVADPQSTGVRVFVASGGTTQSFDAPSGQTSLTAPVTVAAVGATVAVAVLNNGVPGPQGPPVPILVTAPALLLAAYDTVPEAALLLQWQPSSEPGVTGYVAVLSQVGAATQWTQTSAAPGVEFDLTLDPALSYQFTIRATAQNGVSQGPTAGPFAPMLAAPAVLLMTYDVEPTALLNILWRPPAGPAPAAYLALLRQNGTPNLWHQTTSATSVGFTQALLATETYTASVRATDAAGVIQGPTAVPTTVISEVPQPTALVYDTAPQALLTARWAAATQPQIAAWVAVLSKIGGGGQWTQTSTLPTAGFSRTLDSTVGYQLTVRGTDAAGTVQGPASPALAVVTDATALTELDYDAATMTVSWTKLPAGTVGGYTVDVAENGAAPVAHPAGDAGRAVLAGALDPAASYQVTVRATDIAGIAAGPASSALAPLTSPPQAPVVAFTGSQLLADWPADHASGVTGYAARLVKNGAAQPAVAVTAASATFADALDAGVVYGCAVRSTGDRIKGPWCDPAPGPYRSVATITNDGSGRLTALAYIGGAGLTVQYDTFGNILATVGTANAAGAGA